MTEEEIESALALDHFGNTVSEDCKARIYVPTDYRDCDQGITYRHEKDYLR